MSPHETLFRLEATQGLDRALVDHTPLCRFTIHDFPGDYYGEDNPSVFEGANTSLIFVVDAQDEPYDHALQSFTTAVTRAVQVNPNIAVEIFINKVDGELFLSDDAKFDCRRDVMTQVTDELAEAGLHDSIPIRYHLTSIYDHSIYEALSRVVQRLIPQLPTLENMLNVLVATCSMVGARPEASVNAELTQSPSENVSQLLFSLLHHRKKRTCSMSLVNCTLAPILALSMRRVWNSAPT